MARFKYFENHIDQFVDTTAVDSNGKSEFRIVSEANIEFQDWLALGNTPDPADIPNPMDAIRAERDRRLNLIDIDIKNGEDGEIGYDLATLRARRMALRRVPQNFPNADIASFDWTVI